jgi:hypothetical protein
LRTIGGTVPQSISNDPTPEDTAESTQMKSAADLLRTAHTAGIALDRHNLRDSWDVHMWREDLISLYTSDSELSSGD